VDTSNHREIEEQQAVLADTEQPQDESQKRAGVSAVWYVALLLAVVPPLIMAPTIGVTAGEIVAWVVLVGFFAATYAMFVKVMQNHYRAEPKTQTLAWLRPDADDFPPNQP
jgi:hypothetical protein